MEKVSMQMCAAPHPGGEIFSGGCTIGLHNSQNRQASVPKIGILRCFFTNRVGLMVVRVPVLNQRGLNAL